MNTLDWITTLLAPVTGIITWLAATRHRQNKVIQEMQHTIYELVQENKRVYAELTEARREIVGLSAQVAKLNHENEELIHLIEKM